MKCVQSLEKKSQPQIGDYLANINTDNVEREKKVSMEEEIVV